MTEIVRDTNQQASYNLDKCFKEMDVKQSWHLKPGEHLTQTWLGGSPDVTEGQCPRLGLRPFGMQASLLSHTAMTTQVLKVSFSSCLAKTRSQIRDSDVWVPFYLFSGGQLHVSALRHWLSGPVTLVTRAKLLCRPPDSGPPGSGPLPAK